jgi:hypothetical protein
MPEKKVVDYQIANGTLPDVHLEIWTITNPIFYKKFKTELPMGYDESDTEEWSRNKLQEFEKKGIDEIKKHYEITGSEDDEYELGKETMFGSHA